MSYNSNDFTANGGGREMNDRNASMSGDTSSRGNVNNEGTTAESTFSADGGSSDRFDDQGASTATSAGQSGAGNIGSSGKYSSREGAYPSESTETYSAGSDDTESRGNEVGRQMGDEYASRGGDTSSEPNINNEFSNSSGDGSYDQAQGSSSAAFETQRGGQQERGAFEDGGVYEGAKGYGNAPVERSEATGDFQ
ncbi:hypothetical protein BCR35DRAFT_306350 [Leucosporidium creatinivorum]|uniref:Uncharacterized protein n=1 Tax=Leucosporidium creatinivorum TaxID=106004 RepID=A0A1Y2EX17_9BASI|nr:hypothetical protein BCR35DRAFT_306350 [Leucosporidium creatinivorum]